MWNASLWNLGIKRVKKITLHPLKWVKGAWATLSENLGMLQTLLVLICGLWANAWSSCSTQCPKLQDQEWTERSAEGPYCHELLFISTSTLVGLSAVCSLSTGTREAKWTCQYFKRSFSSEQVQVSQSPLYKCNPLQETSQCSSQCCCLFPCGTIWMELSLVDLAQAGRKNTKKPPQKTPNTLRSWLFWHCLLTGYSLLKEELSFLRPTGVKFLTLLSVPWSDLIRVWTMVCVLAKRQGDNSPAGYTCCS